MSFSLFKKSPSLSFVFDIRDASVSLAAVRFQNGEKPEMILCQNFELEFRDSKDHEKYLSAMIAVLDKAIVSVRKGLVEIGNKDSIGAYYFFIGSPWIVSESKTIKIIKDRPFEITHEFLERILVGEEANIEKQIEEQTFEKNWGVLEEKIIQSRINGYKIDDALGEKTADLAIELFVSFIPNDIKNKMASYMDGKIGKSVERRNNSCILSSYLFLRDLYSNRNDFIYADIGKLITDIYVVRDDIIFGVASFPIGEENIIQASLSKTNLSKDVFMSHLNIGQDNKFELPSHNNGGDLLKAGFEIWEGGFRDSLSKICTEMNIPNSIFIIANSVVSSLLVERLADAAKNKKLEIMGSKIQVLVITEGIINGLVSNGKDFANEPYIKMDLVFLNAILKQ